MYIYVVRLQGWKVVLTFSHMNENVYRYLCVVYSDYFRFYGNGCNSCLIKQINFPNTVKRLDTVKNRLNMLKNRLAQLYTVRHHLRTAKLLSSCKSLFKCIFKLTPGKANQ